MHIFKKVEDKKFEENLQKNVGLQIKIVTMKGKSATIRREAAAHFL
jgi:hypothetical protein